MHYRPSQSALTYSGHKMGTNSLDVCPIPCGLEPSDGGKDVSKYVVCSGGDDQSIAIAVVAIGVADSVYSVKYIVLHCAHCRKTNMFTCFFSVQYSLHFFSW